MSKFLKCLSLSVSLLTFVAPPVWGSSTNDGDADATPTAVAQLAAMKPPITIADEATAATVLAALKAKDQATSDAMKAAKVSETALQVHLETAQAAADCWPKTFNALQTQHAVLHPQPGTADFMRGVTQSDQNFDQHTEALLGFLDQAVEAGFLVHQHVIAVTQTWAAHVGRAYARDAVMALKDKPTKDFISHEVALMSLALSWVSQPGAATDPDLRAVAERFEQVKAHWAQEFLTDS